MAGMHHKQFGALFDLLPMIISVIGLGPISPIGVLNRGARYRDESDGRDNGRQQGGKDVHRRLSPARA